MRIEQDEKLSIVCMHEDENKRRNIKRSKKGINFGLEFRRKRAMRGRVVALNFSFLYINFQ
jgi:hypothetical protein